MPRISGEKKEETRKRILSVSKKLFMDNGYYKTSTSLIAKEVGIAEGTIFNYFETKADIFISSLSDSYIGINAEDVILQSSSDVIELIMKYINNRLSGILMLPKKVLIELSTVLLGKATSKKNLVEDLMLVDENYIEKLVNFIEYLQKENLIKETSSKTISECIFGIVLMEIFIYLNVQSYSKDDLIDGIKEKIKVLMTGHLISK